jgi:hypothetical protein
LELGEKVEAGVVAARMGVRFFEGMGFVLDEWVEILGYEKHSEPVRLWIGTRGGRKLVTLSV